MARTAIGVVLSVLGAAAGAAVGYMLFRWLWNQGLYALVLPGACLGLGANLASRDRSLARGIVLGVLGIAIGIYTEWRYAPFVADKTLPYFVAHIQDLKPWTQIMMAMGGLFAFWWGKEGAPWAERAPRPRSEPVEVKGRVEGDQD